MVAEEIYPYHVVHKQKAVRKGPRDCTNTSTWAVELLEATPRVLIKLQYKEVEEIVVRLIVQTSAAVAKTGHKVQ